MKRFRYIILFCLLAHVCLAQDSLKSKQEAEDKEWNSDFSFLDTITKAIYETKKVDIITQSDVDYFVHLLIKRCNTNNAEWGEWSNHVLFDLLEYKTKEMLHSFVKVDSIKFNSCIIGEISAPIDDLIPIKKILDEVKHADCNQNIKNKVINALNINILPNEK